MYIKGGIYKDKICDYNCFIILNELKKYLK